MPYKLQKLNVVKIATTKEKAEKLLDDGFKLIKDDDKEPLEKSDKKGGAK